MKNIWIGWILSNNVLFIMTREVKVGDFVKINFTGRIKGGRVFDTTYENVAKEHGIYREGFKYKPINIIVGEGHVIKGLEEAIIGMKVGEKKNVEIPPEKAFGKRDERLVRIFPMKQFKRQGINPVPGMLVEINGVVGKIISIDGGRVKIDFNPELAGKVVEYEVKVEGIAETIEEKIRFLLERNIKSINPDGIDINIEGDKVYIRFPEDAKNATTLQVEKSSFIDEVFKYLKEIREIVFEERYSRK